MKMKRTTKTDIFIRLGYDWKCDGYEFHEKELIITLIETEYGIENATELPSPTCEESVVCNEGLEMYLFMSFCADYGDSYNNPDIASMTEDLLGSSPPNFILLSKFKSLKNKQKEGNTDFAWESALYTKLDVIFSFKLPLITLAQNTTIQLKGNLHLPQYQKHRESIERCIEQDNCLELQEKISKLSNIGKGKNS